MKFSINLYFSYVCSICVFFCFHFLVVSGKGGGLFGAFKRTKMFYISVLWVASGPRVKLARRKSASHPAHVGLVYRPFWGGGPSVSLALCCFVIYSTKRFVLNLALWQLILVFFSPFSIAIISLEEARAYLRAFRTFVWLALVWFCLTFFVILAFPGLFSYLFLNKRRLKSNYLIPLFNCMPRC